jgi:outer membrane receptor protein involved in Fe transport
VNHSDDYINDSFSVDVPVGSWITVDLNVSYDLGRRPHAPWLDGTRMSLAVTNLLDRQPPYADSPLFSVGFDVFNADAMGRYIAARVSKRW